MPFLEAVKAAVDDCIRNGILADFLLKNRAETIEMSIFEYDEEKHLKNEREYAYRKGREEGEMKGIYILIEAYLKGEISKEKTIQVLKDAYALKEETAKTYYEEIKNSVA